MDDKKVVQEEVLQRLINEIEGVISSKVRENEQGDIIEIHVLADKSRNAKQIARDIQSATAAKFDIDIDHRVISIAQLNCGELPRRECRLAYKGMELISRGTEIEVKIILSHGGKDYCGYQKGISTRGNINRMVVQATLIAVGDFVGFQGSFILEGVKDIVLADERVINVAVTYVDKKGEELLIGSSVIEGDSKEAVVRAALDAVNRKMNIIIKHSDQ